MSDVQQQLRIAQESKCRRLADMLKSQLRPDEGFTLLLYDYGDGGNISYVSTAGRDEMMQALRELVENLDRDTNPEGIVGLLRKAEARIRELLDALDDAERRIEEVEQSLALRVCVLTPTQAEALQKIREQLGRRNRDRYDEASDPPICWRCERTVDVEPGCDHAEHDVCNLCAQELLAPLPEALAEARKP